METPIVHPKRRSQLKRFYRYRATFGSLDASGQAEPVPGLSNLPAAMVTAVNGGMEIFDDEVDAVRQVALLDYHPQIKPRMSCLLSIGDQGRRYEVVDTEPSDRSLSGTLLALVAK